MTKKHPITVAYGDGIGPEIMQATLDILQAAGAEIEIEKVAIGEKVYLSGHPTGMQAEVLDSIRKTKVFLKAPITTPQGGGYRSLNVTIRGKLGLYANIRPCVSYHPFIETKHPLMDVVIIRENEEDLYTGIEYQQSTDVATATKLISRSGTEKICRYAFEYARRFNRKKVTCFTKDNILKLTDGLFHQVFEQIAKEYSDIKNEHWIVDIGAAKLADSPQDFDVLVLPNLYGDILSDVAAQISGSVGLAGSANIGLLGAMFEAIHGSAPRIANQNVANPSGLIMASILMLVHMHQVDCAALIQNAWLATIEKGIHTYDIFSEGISKKKVGTKEFAKSVIEHLGKKPQTLQSVVYHNTSKEQQIEHPNIQVSQHRKLVGVDFYFVFHESLDQIIQKVKKIDLGSFKMTLITNRGVEIWPKHCPETTLVDQFRLRLEDRDATLSKIAQLYTLFSQHFDLIRTENLYTFENKKGFSHSV